MLSFSGKPGEAGRHLLQLALAMYRNELRAMPEAELPDAMHILLRLANGDAELLDWARQVSGADMDEVRNSCITFIEREFLGGETDPYRVLGLNPWATADDIKEHYRLLIRLFHPDRGVVERAVAESYAAMINQAHSELKQLSAGDTYASQQTQVVNNAGAAEYAGRRVHVRQHAAKAAAPAPTGYRAWEIVAWLTPAKVLGLIAIMATVIVLLLLLQQKRAAVQGAEVALAAGIAATDMTKTEISQAGIAKNRQDVAADSNAVEAGQYVPDVRPLPGQIAQADIATTVTPANAAQAISLQQGSVASGNAVTARTTPVKRRAVNAAQKPGLLTEENGAQQLALAGTGSVHGTAAGNRQPEAVAALQVQAADAYAAHIARLDATANPTADSAATAGQAPSDLELHDLIAQFMGSYNRGDVSGFMQVFDEQVRSDDAAGKAGLQQSYSRFFNSTISRSMVLRNLQWQRSGAIASGKAEYRASSTRAEDSEERTSVGTLRFEVSKSGKQVMIVGFFHQADKK